MADQKFNNEALVILSELARLIRGGHIDIYELEFVSVVGEKRLSLVAHPKNTTFYSEAKKVLTQSRDELYALVDKRLHSEKTHRLLSIYKQCEIAISGHSAERGAKENISAHLYLEGESDVMLSFWLWCHIQNTIEEILTGKPLQ